MDKEKMIADYMKKLGISREDAIQLIEDDENDFIGDEGEQMTQKAKAYQHRESGEKSKRKSNKPPKIDELKVKIIEYIADAMENRHRLIEENEWNFSEVFVKNPQKEITFTIDDCEYSLSLTKHRPKK